MSPVFVIFQLLVSKLLCFKLKQLSESGQLKATDLAKVAKGDARMETILGLVNTTLMVSS